MNRTKRTLRGAIKRAKKDTVIEFDISCKDPTIELEKPLDINKKKKITIDGSNQHKKGGAVTIVHYQVTIKRSEDIKVRNIRFRPGRKTIDEENDEKNCCEGAEDCMTGNDALRIVDSEDVLLEKCSFGLASDEALSVSDSEDVILRNNILGSGITKGGKVHFEWEDGKKTYAGYHNFGSLMQDNKRLVMHNNLWAGDFQDRCPQ